MTWQEYQQAVYELYENMKGVGTVHNSITRPDKLTGQPRQIDTWLEIEGKGHKLGILIDAKFRSEKVDVKDVEEVLALANAVGANKSVLVALSGWTEPARVKADFVGMDLKLLSLEEALDLIVPEKWMMCPNCEQECIVADIQGAMEVHGMWSVVIAGQCRGCKSALIWCWDCGNDVVIEPNTQHECGCEHIWSNTPQRILVKREGYEDWVDLLDTYGSTEELVLDIPEPIPPTVDDAEFFLQRGIAYLNRSKTEEALKDFTTLIQLIPTSPVAYYHRASTYDMADLPEKALSDYGKVIELDSEFAIAYGARGAVYYSTENYKEALADFNRFLELMPDSPNEQFVQAAIAHCQHEID